MNKLIGLLFCCFSVLSISAQELNCQVNIITNAKLEVTTVDQEVLDQLKEVMKDFMNNTQWTKDKFKTEERINCNIQFNVSKIPAQGVYEGSMQIQSTRPAFNSSYNSTLFNFLDDYVQIAFSRNSIISYAPNQFRDNLTSILAFYAYYIIGLDYDSFSLKGGTPYFNEAQSIVSIAQSSGVAGWKSNEAGKRNRYWLIDNAMHQLFEPLRECYYNYHRKGIDKLYENKVEAKKEMYNALNLLAPIVTVRPGSINIMNFAQCKLQELKNLYSDSDQKEKTDIVNLLKKIDPANANKYQEILN